MRMRVKKKKYIYIYIYILKGDVAQMVEYEKACPRNEDWYLASPFSYKNLQTLAHPTSFIHKTTLFKIALFFKHDDLLLFFLF